MPRLMLACLLPLIIGACSVPQRVPPVPTVDPAAEPFCRVTGEAADLSWSESWGIPLIGPKAHQSVALLDDTLTLTQGTSSLVGLFAETDVYKYTPEGALTSRTELEMIGYFLLYGHLHCAGGSSSNILSQSERDISLDDKFDLHLVLLGLGHASLVKDIVEFEKPRHESYHLTLLGLLNFTHVENDDVDTRILLGLLGWGREQGENFARFLFFKIPLGGNDEA